MRKIALKLKYPNRGVIFEQLRKENFIETVIDRNGKSIALNLKKHLLFGKSYKNEEYQNELLRFQKHGG